VRRTIPTLAIAAMILGSACATSSLPGTGSETVPPGGPGARTVTITSEDAGKTISVIEGQTLVFQRTSEESSPRPWTFRVAAFPPFLVPKSDLAKMPFTFLVAHAGRGSLVLIESPCPPIQADATTGCPLAGPPGAALRQITISIVAQGRGI
jgi:hypothetical protein